MRVARGIFSSGLSGAGGSCSIGSGLSVPLDVVSAAGLHCRRGFVEGAQHRSRAPKWRPLAREDASAVLQRSPAASAVRLGIERPQEAMLAKPLYLDVARLRSTVLGLLPPSVQELLRRRFVTAVPSSGLLACLGDGPGRLKTSCTCTQGGLPPATSATSVPWGHGGMRR